MTDSVRQGPLVSVVLPARNAEKRLKIAADSILNQTIDDLELIIVNDQSDDSTLEVAKSIASADHRVRVIDSGSPHGLVTALTQGTAMARGQFIARMDADDISFPDRLQKQVEFLDRNSEISACGTCVRVANPLGKGISRAVLDEFALPVLL